MTLTIPYAPRRMYEPDGSIAELVRRSGQAQAEGIRRGGDISANMWGNLGQIGSQAVADYNRNKQAEAARKRREPIEAEQLKSAQNQNAMSALQLESATKARDDSRRASDVISQGGVLGVTRQKILEQAKADPAIFEEVTAHIQREQAIENELFGEAASSVLRLSPGNLAEGAVTKLQDMVERGRMDKGEAESYIAQLQQNPDFARSLLLGALTNSPNKAHNTLAMAFEANEMKAAEAQRKAAEDAERKADRDADNARADKALSAQMSHQERMARIAQGGGNSRIWVMRPGPDGKMAPVRVSESQVMPGDQPASTREQGRPVTSGDAGRFAELDASLDDLKILKDTLGTTGAGSKVGAMLPNIITEYTGWGSDSKQRQATIDRVKQVIGKALEGGVLRKEDELKYTKILPTIGDPPEVAKAKIEGLEVAIAQRKQRELEARQDAGYDVSKFLSRQNPETSKPSSFSVTAPDGKTYSFSSQSKMDAFKKAAGIR